MSAPNTNVSVRALRALSALVLHRMLKPALFMIVIILSAFYVLTILLTLSFSAWWLLILILLLPLTLVLLILGYVMWFLLQKLLPRKLSTTERNRLDAFIEKISDIADRIKLPYPVMILLVVKDVIRGKESKFIRGIIGDSKELTAEFGEIQELFKESAQEK